eukprot:2937072-Rhodomonas_salina.1
MSEIEDASLCVWMWKSMRVDVRDHACGCQRSRMHGIDNVRVSRTVEKRVGGVVQGARAEWMGECGGCVCVRCDGQRRASERGREGEREHERASEQAIETESQRQSQR